MGGILLLFLELHSSPLLAPLLRISAMWRSVRPRRAEISGRRTISV
jgi:hypothetical protein